MKSQHQRRSYLDDIFDLQQEVLRLREELQEERRMRVFAVAALNQRLGRLERSMKVPLSEDDEEEPQQKRERRKVKPSVPGTKKSAFTKEVPANPSVPADAPSKPVKVVTSHVSKDAMLKNINPEPPSMPPPQENPPQEKPRQAEKPTATTASPPLSAASLSLENMANARAPPVLQQQQQHQQHHHHHHQHPHENVVRSPTSILSSTPGSPNNQHKVQFADEYKEEGHVFQPGEQVLVRCVEGSNEPKWDPAVIAKLETGGKYCVRFPDGEEWAEVPVSELRKTTDTPTSSLFGLLLNENVYFSGFVWLHEMGWLQTNVKKQWLMVLEGKLYFAADPSETEFERELPLKGKTVDTNNFEGSNAPAGMTFSVKGGGEVYNFVCESEYDRNVWVAKLRLGVVKAGGTLTVAEKDACVEASKTIARPIVPINDKLKAEDAHTCLIKGYVVSRSANAWFTKGDWARRWITLHPGWLTLRPNKETPTGATVVPLKDTALALVKTDPENPYSIEIGGPFVKPPITLCFDSSPLYLKWCLLIEQSYLKANPEKLSSGLDMQEITEDDIVEEKRPEVDLDGDGGQI